VRSVVRINSFTSSRQSSRASQNAETDMESSGITAAAVLGGMPTFSVSEVEIEQESKMLTNARIAREMLIMQQELDATKASLQVEQRRRRDADFENHKLQTLVRLLQEQLAYQQQQHQNADTASHNDNDHQDDGSNSGRDAVLGSDSHVTTAARRGSSGPVTTASMHAPKSAGKSRSSSGSVTQYEGGSASAPAAMLEMKSNSPTSRRDSSRIHSPHGATSVTASAIEGGSPSSPHKSFQDVPIHF
jgi:hypothetical protein